MYTGSASVKPDVQVKRWHVQRTSWMREEYDEWKGGGGSTRPEFKSFKKFKISKL